MAATASEAAMKAQLAGVQALLQSLRLSGAVIGPYIRPRTAS